MPYEFEVDPRARVVTIKGSVTPNAEASRDVLSEVVAHPDYQPGFGLFMDMRGLVIPPDADTVLAGSQNVVRFRPSITGPMAVVVPTAFELHSEIYIALFASAGLEAQTFTEYEEARNWLKETMASGAAA